jgi:uncharacterized protein
MKEVLEYLARSLVDDPDAVRVSESTEGDGAVVVLRLSVAPDDMGKVIGKGGRTARAIRRVVQAAGTREGVRAIVEIVE